MRRSSGIKDYLSKARHEMLALIRAIFENELSVRAAALAYYALFSMFPLLLLLISAAGFILQSAEWQSLLVAEVSRLLPTRGHVIGMVLEQVVGARGPVGVLGMLALLWAASGFFGALEASINHIFASEQRRSWWRRRGLGMLMVLLMAPLLSLAVLLSSLSNLLASLSIIPQAIQAWLRTGLDYLLTLALIVFVLSVLLHWIPKRQPGWLATFTGAILSALLWTGITTGFTWYLSSGWANYNLVYGPLAAVIALVLWLYLSSFVVLLGATFTAYLQWGRTGPAAGAEERRLP